MPKHIHAEEPVIVPSSEPLPRDPNLLVAQIKEYAEARRLAAMRHDHWCRCTPCKVRMGEERRAAIKRAAA